MMWISVGGTFLGNRFKTKVYTGNSYIIFMVFGDLYGCQVLV